VPVCLMPCATTMNQTDRSEQPTGQTASVESAPGFVALSRFVIANAMGDEVKAAFRDSQHLVDGALGYLRMEVISPLERPEEIWLGSAGDAQNAIELAARLVAERSA